MPAPGALVLLLLAPAALPGCILYDEPGPTEVTGEVKGYAPTQAFLKLEVETEDGRRISVDFDRRDWHVRALGDRVDHRELKTLVVAGQERNIPGAVLAERFLSPEDLNALRYEEMGASAEERERLDAEYDEWLAELARRAAGDVGEAGEGAGDRLEPLATSAPSAPGPVQPM